MRVTVLGCGGDRDPAKRRPMGAAAAQHGNRSATRASGRADRLAARRSLRDRPPGGVFAEVRALPAGPPGFGGLAASCSGWASGWRSKVEPRSAAPVTVCRPVTKKACWGWVAKVVRRSARSTRTTTA